MKYPVILCFVAFINLLATDAYSQGTGLSFDQKSSTLEKAILENDLLISKPVKQAIQVSGQVTDVEGIGLPGVNIIEKGTTNGTITNLDGQYSITVANESSILIFSFMGYVTQEVTVGNQAQISIVLAEEIRELEELVVIGYGTVKKSDVTGSLASVTAEQLQEMPMQNVNQGIQGKAAGVDVYNNNFTPGEAPTIRVRGERSIKGNNDPLYIIDGIPAMNIHEINPQDIQSVEILKDASATAIYGSRGANGVILITTKRGTGSKASINYEGSWSFDQILREVDMFNAAEWTEMKREASRTAGRYTLNDTVIDYADPSVDERFFGSEVMDEESWKSIMMGYEWEDSAQTIVRRDENGIPIYHPENVRSYDWGKHGLRTALNQNHQLSISGGSENLGVLLSVGYLNQEGIVKTQNYERFSTRLNLDYDVNKWLKAGMSNSYSLALQDYGTDMYGKTLRQLPITVPYDEEGNFIEFPGGDDLIKNPLEDPRYVTDNRRITHYFGSYYAEVKFFEGFKYRINVGQDYKYWRRGQYQSSLSSDRGRTGSDYANNDQNQRYDWVVENLLYFDKTLGQHTIGITLMQSAEARRYEQSGIQVYNLPYESQLWYNVGTTRDGNPYDFGSSYWRRQMLSYMGRINYGFMDRYLLTASLRRDGTSVFHPDNQWDYFPSFALAWKAHEEAIFANVSWISQLKLRAGYGTTGQSATDPYETKGSVSQSNYCFESTPARGFVINEIETRDVGWEKTKSLNGGFDFGFFKNRVNGIIDVYRANTYDLLLDRTLPPITGVTHVRANIGQTRNQGVEIILNTVNINTGGFIWETELMYTRNRNEIIELYGEGADDLGNRWFIGEPIEVFYDYKINGIYQYADSAEMALLNANSGNFQPGDIRIENAYADSTINEEDQVILGSPYPDWTGGITNRFSYKGFELSFFVYFRIGQGMYNRALVPTLAGRYADRKVDYWTPTNPTNEYPRPDSRLQFPQYSTSLYYMDVSFIKVRYITLSYEIPTSLISKIGIKRLNIYAQALNPFIFTNYPLVDPEVQGDPNNATSGLSNLSTKSYVFGVKLGL